MKAQFNAMSLLCITALLTGCGIEPALSGKARGEYLRSIKHYIEWWDKPGMTVEGRRRDWMECGGTGQGDFRPNERNLNLEKRPGEKDDIAAYYRLQNELHRCMINKGYRYTGRSGSAK